MYGENKATLNLNYTFGDPTIERVLWATIELRWYHDYLVVLRIIFKDGFYFIEKGEKQ